MYSLKYADFKENWIGLDWTELDGMGTFSRLCDILPFCNMFSFLGRGKETSVLKYVAVMAYTLPVVKPLGLCYDQLMWLISHQ